MGGLCKISPALSLLHILELTNIDMWVEVMEYTNSTLMCRGERYFPALYYDDYLYEAHGVGCFCVGL
jgi:hypothetical protein